VGTSRQSPGQPAQGKPVAALRAILLLAVAVIVSGAKVARAADLETSLLRAVLQFLEIDEAKLRAKGRRATAIGPWVGAAVVSNTSRGAWGGSFPVGIGLFVFSDPILDLFDLRQRIIVLTMKKMTAEEIAREIKAEFRASVDAPPAAWPGAMFALNGEIDFNLGAGQARMARVSAALGAGKFTVGGTLAVELGTPVTLLFGPELGTSFLIGEGPRPWLLNVFTRYDFRVSSANKDQSLSLGARMLFDII